MRLRAADDFYIVTEHRRSDRIELGIDQRIRQFHYLPRTDLPQRVNPYVEIHRIRSVRGIRPDTRQKHI